MVKECPNNDMTENMIQQTFYRRINTTNKCVVNQLAGGNFMTMPYAEACEILDEMLETSSTWQSRSNIPQGDPNMIHLHKELQEWTSLDNHNDVTSKGPTKSSAKSQESQCHGGSKHDGEQEKDQGSISAKSSGELCGRNSGFEQDDSYNEQEEEVQYVNNFQGQRNNFQGPNQQQWRPQNNQSNWNSNNQGNWSGGNNQGNWHNNNNQGNLSGNNQGNWGSNNQGGWKNNQGNWGSGFQRPLMFQQLSNPPPYPFHGPSSSNNEGHIENMFKQMMKKNVKSDANLLHTTHQSIT
ncbi:uncharacterized protein [Nicotiana sylvestris]|uniref:uncharacterized protein n=1 Tax=Nicotiana sylvestris TaxID=4096 RepID=UPI00388C7345